MASPPPAGGLSCVPGGLLDVAVRAARAGARVIRAAGRRPAGHKSSGTDPVTEIDLASEAAITAFLAAARPDDGLLGEEGAARAGTSGLRWVVDPVDGTTNLLYGSPHVTISIAVERQHRTDLARRSSVSSTTRPAPRRSPRSAVAAPGSTAPRCGSTTRCRLDAGPRRDRFRATSRRPGPGRRRQSPDCSTGSVTSAATAAPPWSCAGSPPAAATPTTRTNSRPGTSRRVLLIAAEAGAIVTTLGTGVLGRRPRPAPRTRPSLERTGACPPYRVEQVT